MKNYMVHIRINNAEYMTKIIANSNSEAEHYFLDKSYSGRHTYSVEGCQAFAPDELKTDFFIGTLLNSILISSSEICTIISDRNEELRNSDRAEKLISDNKKRIAELQKEIEEAEKQIIK